MRMYDITDKENGNDIMSAVVINTEAYMKNNLQRESLSSLFKLFRVIVFVYKLVEKLKLEIKIKIKKVENKIEKNIPDIILGIMNTEDINAASNL